MAERATVTVLRVEVADSGYLGTTATVEEHMDEARRKVQNWEFFVKQGSRDGTKVPAAISVEQVIVIPMEG